MIIVNRRGPGFERDPGLCGSAAASTTAAATAPRGARSSRRSRGCTDNDVASAHIRDVGQSPNPLLPDDTTQIHRTTPHFRSGRAEQGIPPAAATAPAATTGSSITAGGGSRCLLAERNQCHCGEPERGNT